MMSFKTIRRTSAPEGVTGSLSKHPTGYKSKVGQKSFVNKVCGDCSLCCKVYRVDDLEKKAHQACDHTRHKQNSSSSGCGIWGLHPQSCQTLKCLWLKHADMNALWRPDIAGFVLRVMGTALHIDSDHDRPKDWQREPYYSQFKAWSKLIEDGSGLLVVNLKDAICLITPLEDLYLKGPKRGEHLETGIEMTLFGPRVFARVAKVVNTLGELKRA
jgi:hypothetical protein